MHVTQRASVPEILAMLEKHLPPEIYAKVIVLMDRKWRTNQ